MAQSGITFAWDRIKALILQPRRLLQRNMLIEKLEKLTIQKGGRNAAVECRSRRAAVETKRTRCKTMWFI